MVDPNFMLIGAQKSGTSWLAEMLKQHPEIYVPEKKELHFFNLKSNYARGIEWYRGQFEGWAGQPRVGDCTPNYLWELNATEAFQSTFRNHDQSPISFQTFDILNRNVAKRVWQHYPELKLIVTLRNPVNRSISGFMHAIRARRISPRSRILDVCGQEGILGMSIYYQQLMEWMKFFPTERFLFLVYEEDIRQNKSETLRRVFRHLEVDRDFEVDNPAVIRNERACNLYMYLNYYAPWLPSARINRISALRRFNFPPIRVTDSDRAKLYDFFQSEYGKLEELLGRSLAAWEPG